MRNANRFRRRSYARARVVTATRCVAVIVAVVLLAGLAAPQTAQAAPLAAQAAPQAAEATPQAAQAAANGGGVIDRVLVRVNGAPILHSDFETQWEERLAVIAGQLPQEELDAQAPALRLTLLRAMVEEVMMDQRAEELGFVADPNDIDRALMNIREENGYLDDDAWQQALASNGLTEAALRQTIGRSIVQQRMIFQEIQQQVFVNDREVMSYYEQNIDDFSEPEQVLFQQLVFVAAEGNPAPAQERAEQALAELRSGVSLSSVAAKYISPTDSYQSADRASWIPTGDLQPEIAAAVTELSPLAYSEIIEGRFGFYILQLMDRREASTRPLEEVAREVRALLESQKSEQKFQEYTQELLTQVHLEVLAEEFADLESAWEGDNQGAPARTPGQRR